MLLKKKETTGFEIIFNKFGQIKIKRSLILKKIKVFYRYIF